VIDPYSSKWNYYSNIRTVQTSGQLYLYKWEVIVRSVVLTFGDLVASELARFKAYGSINGCQE